MLILMVAKSYIQERGDLDLTRNPQLALPLLQWLP